MGRRLTTEPHGAVRDRIVDAALELAEERGWANVRLYQVAEHAGVPLAEVGAEFRDQPVGELKLEDGHVAIAS